MSRYPLLRLTFEALLVSAVLAGARRSSGLTLATEKIETEPIRFATQKYLESGEWVMDELIEIMSKSPSWFRRKFP
ncbi:hypothetical protein HMI54_014245 [Coelomomyces lativittatus]|nr:hypothetical protein HMI56_005311 [Coelomomyces lativittatus]KAJ1517634.1 hypothetical protein HMI55_006463 [Coelomomyces lativittatus]KAJ1518621.1 hypothetical protein HMI54_014245 [Coelomomyces lativittatus]